MQEETQRWTKWIAELMEGGNELIIAGIGPDNGCEALLQGSDDRLARMLLAICSKDPRWFRLLTDTLNMIIKI